MSSFPSQGRSDLGHPQLLTITTSPLAFAPSGAKLIVKSAPSLSLPASVSPERVTLRPFLANSAVIQSAAFVGAAGRTEAHTSELQTLMRISYAALRLTKKKKLTKTRHYSTHI